MPHIEVNEENIDRFALHELTGNTREEMLSRAAEARMNGYTLSCEVPDDLIHLNIFDTAPKVEHDDVGRATSIADSLVPNDRCRYEKKWTDEVGTIDVCIIHGQNSKHDTTVEPQAPCLHVDPY